MKMWYKLKEYNYYVYILCSRRNGTFYTGVTNDLIRRVYEHKEGLVEGFTKKYKIKMLVYFEHCNDINAAIHREKIIKKWKRSFKLDAIEKMNPNWNDLYYDLTDALQSVTPHSLRGPEADAATSAA